MDNTDSVSFPPRPPLLGSRDAPSLITWSGEEALLSSVIGLPTGAARSGALGTAPGWEFPWCDL